MPAYESEHSAAQSTVEIASHAYQASTISVKSGFHVAQGAVHGTKNAYHAGQKVHGMASRVRRRILYGRPLGPRTAPLSYRIKQRVKKLPGSSVRGGLKLMFLRSPRAYYRSARLAGRHGFTTVERASANVDETTRLAYSEYRQLVKLPGRVRKTAVNTVKVGKAVWRVGKAAARLVRALVMGVIKLVGFLGLPGVVVLSVVLVVASIVPLFWGFFSAGCSGASSPQVSVANFGAISGRLDGLKIVEKGQYQAIDYMGMGFSKAPYHNNSRSYPFEQCTWWAALRREQLGQPVTEFMGNGGSWADSARRQGWLVESTPRLGDVISYKPGTLGSSSIAGHVSVVEQINDDGSIWVSESGTGWFKTVNAPVITRLSAKALMDNRQGLRFIHASRSVADPSSPSLSSSSSVSYGCPVENTVEASGGDGSVKEAKSYAKSLMEQYGWDENEFTALDKLWQKESGWRWNAENPASKAYGIPQALPGSKMASADGDWKTNAHTQIKWGLDYIKHRYKSPLAAWKHSQDTNWY